MVYNAIQRHKKMSIQNKLVINIERRRYMNTELFVGVDKVKSDLGVSRAKAYEIIKDLNRQLKEVNPRAVIVSGKVNRIWYEEAVGYPNRMVN